MVYVFSVKIVSALNWTVFLEEVKLPSFSISSFLPTSQLLQPAALMLLLWLSTPGPPVGVQEEQIQTYFSGTLMLSRYLLSIIMCVSESSLSNDIMYVRRKALVTSLFHLCNQALTICQKNLCWIKRTQSLIASCFGTYLSFAGCVKKNFP